MKEYWLAEHIENTTPIVYGIFETYAEAQKEQKRLEIKWGGMIASVYTITEHERGTN